ncbi:MAG: thioredoxin family protein [Hyphomicrobiales bacterium]|nr:thioredoxin family protein [Hyphomicrobiales bacterium]
MTLTLQLALALALGLSAGHSALARESAPVKTAHAVVTLVSETDAVEPGKPFRLGLHFALAEGWHIYWINPGEAGEPPRIDLTLPEGATASSFSWPAPLRIPEGPAITYSYIGDITLPLTVTPPSSLTAASFPVKAKASWLICETICVPEEGNFELDLSVETSTLPSREAPLFTAADERLPRPSPFEVRLAPDGALSLIGNDIAPSSVHDAWFFPEKSEVIDDAAPQALVVGEGNLTLSLKPAKGFDPKSALSGVLVLKSPSGAERFFQIGEMPKAATVALASPATSSAPERQPTATANGTSGENADLGLLAMLVFALLGGLTLNLMPCVFPILAIKAVGIASLSGHERGTVRAHALSYTLGVLLAFAALGVSLIAFRTAGSFAGWGFQFQSPVFVAAMALVFTLVGLNLSGVFEMSFGSVGAGGTLAARAGHVGSFFTGLLAVLVATPCTAPFMGAAIAAALTALPLTMIAVFLAMGVGLAAPYVLIAFVPGLARLLPKPGSWMVVFRQALAFPMYAAAAWLVWVISQQAGPDGVLATVIAMVLLGLAAWIFGLTQTREGRPRAVGNALAALAALGAFFALFDVMASPRPAAVSSIATGDEKPYSASQLASLRAQGRPVFVNMTAAWCVTCLVNERIALSSEAVRQAFADHHVAYLKGDWTRADPAISDFLREHGRDGVPLYVLFPAKGGNGVVLPQILTASAVLEALNHFGS